MSSPQIGRVSAVCISDRKGVGKRPVSAARLIPNSGLEGDAHAGPGPRQVSLLADEQVDIVRAGGVDLSPGDFGENILTRGVDFKFVDIGAEIRIGEVILEVTQIGKKCHHRCAIYDAAGMCVMPTDGIFCRVVKGGTVASGDSVSLESVLFRGDVDNRY